ncbi:MAG TPA: hypothetical protein VEW46_14160 [Pyrinomonadaceae bacterium]|nr:hypothetical protein [Pyrinomonadaceae bacterium]
MFSPTSIANFLACQHLTALNRAEAAGEIKKPFFADPGLVPSRTVVLVFKSRVDW